MVPQSTPCTQPALKAKILIVEDQGIVALDLRTKMERLGYTVLDVVSSRVEAIKKAANLQPDLVIMDIRLRGSITGIEAAHAIWSRFNIPAVYLTAVGDRKILDRALCSREQEAVRVWTAYR